MPVLQRLYRASMPSSKCIGGIIYVVGDDLNDVHIGRCMYIYIYIISYDYNSLLSIPKGSFRAKRLCEAVVLITWTCIYFYKFRARSFSRLLPGICIKSY